MSWPTDNITTTHLDAATDDPSQARAELKVVADRVKDVIAGRGTTSGVCDLDSSGYVPSTRLTSSLLTGVIGFTPLQQGGGSGQDTTKVKIGKSSSAAKLKADVGGADYGNLATESWAMPVAGGTMTGALTVQGNVVATSGYGDTVTIGGDAAGSDFELKLSSASRPVNVYSAAGNVTFGVTGTITASAGLNIDSGALYVDGSNNRVGINDTSPSYSLDVNGTAHVTGAVTLGSTVTSAGTITIDSASGNAALTVDKTADTDYALIQGYKAGLRRWAIALGENTAEGGSNAGSNFKIFGYNDAGDYLNTPLTITRSTGDATFSQAVTAGTYFVAGDGYGLRFGDGTARIYGSGSSDTISYYVDASEYYRMTTTNLRPMAGGLNLGADASGGRWSNAYLDNCPSVCSDARLKTPVREMSAEEIAAARELVQEIGFYQWLREVETGSATWVCGSTAQKIQDTLLKHSLTPATYNMVTYNAETDSYSVKWEQVALFLARGLDARLQALEALMGDR